MDGRFYGESGAIANACARMPDSAHEGRQISRPLWSLRASTERVIVWAPVASLPEPPKDIVAVRHF